MNNEFYGLYRGFVLDNVDPQQKFRLQVSIPELSDAALWAEACVPALDFTTPNIGDTVWIMFEAGKIRSPVWIGILPVRTA